MKGSRIVHGAILLLIVSLFCFDAGASGSFSLKIDDVSGIDSTWPLIASIPFHERRGGNGAGRKYPLGAGRLYRFSAGRIPG